MRLKIALAAVAMILVLANIPPRVVSPIAGQVTHFAFLTVPSLFQFLGSEGLLY